MRKKYNTISAMFVSQFPMIGSLYTKVGFFRSYDRPFDTQVKYMEETQMTMIITILIIKN